MGCAGLSAQAAQDDAAVAPKPRHAHSSGRVLPFPYEPSVPQGASAIEFRSFEQMTPQDRDLAADGESSIGERAGFAGLEFNEGKWAYRQVVCRALPNHLFLQFTRNNGAADESLFSASIPRGGDGRVRIIPIKRRGYSLFSPAPINALTISAFNHIRGEEHVEQAPQWLGTGLCYAALAGAQPVAAPPANAELPGSSAIGGPAVLETPNQAGAVIRFVDVAAAHRPMEWTMRFNSKGKLLKATHVPASLAKVKTLEPGAVDAKGVELHPVPVDMKGKPVE